MDHGGLIFRKDVEEVRVPRDPPSWLDSRYRCEGGQPSEIVLPPGGGTSMTVNAEYGVRISVRSSLEG